MSRKRACMTLVAAMLSLGIGLAEDRPSPAYSSLDFPGATFTAASGINAEGEVVGTYVDAAGKAHGFLLQGWRWTSIDYPGALSTSLRGINERGDIVGTHTDTAGLPGGGSNGFLLQRGVFTDINYPGHLNTIPVRVTDEGQVVGCYHDADTMGSMHGFIFSDGQYSALDGSYTGIDVPASMNNGETPDGSAIAGLYTDMMTGKGRAYLASGGVFAPFDFPFSTATALWDMNGSGEVVGSYTDAAKKGHGFLLNLNDSLAAFKANPQEGLTGPFGFESIDYPGATTTNAYGVSPRGDVVGSYVDAGKQTHGFFLRLRRNRRHSE